MSITREQLIKEGFVPAKRQKGLGKRKYDTYIFKLNKTDYFYFGYNDFRGDVNFKILWKSIETEEHGRISYIIERLGTLTLAKVKDLIKSALVMAELKDKLKKELEQTDGGDSK